MIVECNPSAIHQVEQKTPLAAWQGQSASCSSLWDVPYVKVHLLHNVCGTSVRVRLF
jgi:hypothetical protein